jgi:hypothetical protein
LCQQKTAENRSVRRQAGTPIRTPRRVASRAAGRFSRPRGQEHLSIWASRFADLARQAETRPALLTAWPNRERRSLLPDVVASYRLAARAAGAGLFPAGEAWQAVWQCSPHVWLYSSDGIHPSRLGKYEAALVVYGALFDAPVRSRRLDPVGEKPRMSRLLQAGAATALGRWLPLGGRCG